MTKKKGFELIFYHKMRMGCDFPGMRLVMRFLWNGSVSENVGKKRIISFFIFLRNDRKVVVYGWGLEQNSFYPVFEMG